MKIIELRCENVKRLQAVRITPEGSLVVVGGKNGAGKSSVLDSILYGLTGAKSLPGKPVRSGEEKAEVVITLDSKPNLIVRRRIKDTGATTLEIEQINDDGTRAKIASPQKLLDSLVGSIAFDPLSFTRLKPQEQVELLKAAVGVTTDDIDAETKRLFDDRTNVNRDVKTLESQIAGMPQHADAPADIVLVSGLLGTLGELRERNQEGDRLAQTASDSEREWLRAHDEVESREQSIQQLEEELGKLRGQLGGWSKKAASLRKSADAAKAAAEAFTPEDETPLLETIRDAEVNNAKVAANKDREGRAEQLAAAKEQSDDLTTQIEQLRTARIDRLAAAEWPVDGLGFGDDGVTFRGLPFEQCSSAEQLRISTAIALSQNPKLPIGIIRDGSLLDADSLALVAELAEQYGAQIWVERVGNGDECSIVIEDGTVAQADAVA